MSLGFPGHFYVLGWKTPGNRRVTTTLITGLKYISWKQEAGSGNPEPVKKSR